MRSKVRDTFSVTSHSERSYAHKRPNNGRWKGRDGEAREQYRLNGTTARAWDERVRGVFGIERASLANPSKFIEETSKAARRFRHDERGERERRDRSSRGRSTERGT